MNLNQFNLIPNYKNNILDLCFSNLDLSVTHCFEPISVVDNAHPPIDIQVDNLIVMSNFLILNMIIFLLISKRLILILLYIN